MNICTDQHLGMFHHSHRIFNAMLHQQNTRIILVPSGWQGISLQCVLMLVMQLVLNSLKYQTHIVTWYSKTKREKIWNSKSYFSPSSYDYKLIGRAENQLHICYSTAWNWTSPSVKLNFAVNQFIAFPSLIWSTRHWALVNWPDRDSLALVNWPDRGTKLSPLVQGSFDKLNPHVPIKGAELCRNSISYSWQCAK